MVTCNVFDQVHRKEDKILQQDRISHDTNDMIGAQLNANEKWSAVRFSLLASNQQHNDLATSSDLIAVNVNTNIWKGAHVSCRFRREIQSRVEEKDGRFSPIHTLLFMFLSLL